MGIVTAGQEIQVQYPTVPSASMTLQVNVQVINGQQGGNVIVGVGNSVSMATIPVGAAGEAQVLTFNFLGAAHSDSGQVVRFLLTNAATVHTQIIYVIKAVP